MATIPYKIVVRDVFVKGERKRIYTPKLSSAGKVSTKYLARQVAVESTISDNEAKRFIDGFAMVIRQALVNDFQVKLDKLGTFTPKIKVKAVDSAEDFSLDVIQSKSVEFRPSVEVEDELKTASFRKVNLNLKHV